MPAIVRVDGLILISAIGGGVIPPEVRDEQNNAI